MKDKHFGGLAPYRAYMAKMRWVVALLGSLIMVLVITVGIMLSDRALKGSNAGSEMYASEEIIPPSPHVAVASTIIPKPRTVEILVARKRIEPKTNLDEFFFETKTVAEELVPEGALLASDRGKLVGKFSKSVIPANMYILPEFLADKKPEIPFHIPKGYRTASITINARTGVEGFAKPDTRVDIFWLHRDKNNVPQITTIVRAARILSVGGRTQITGAAPMAGNSTTATLLVTEREAKIIELARETGKLSLSLVSDEETQLMDIDGTVSLYDLLRGKNDPAETEETYVDGTFSTVDPKTGRRVEFYLNDNHWTASEDRLENKRVRKEVGLSKNNVSLYFPNEG